MIKNFSILHAYKRISVKNRGVHDAGSKIKMREAKDKEKVKYMLYYSLRGKGLDLACQPIVYRFLFCLKNRHSTKEQEHMNMESTFLTHDDKNALIFIFETMSIIDT